ncbi:hypothetical protein ACS8YF_14940 [Salinisphaera sp. SWV1]|uniref:hypothetical protein n=1 Tax=Salinisphaera sp. SWV1 TaxID=3454139 RepID=UPI003F83137C
MPTNHRIANPRKDKLDQGYIFTGARAENYEGKQVFGIVITARCDVANKKVRLINYLPVVNFTDWLFFDGRIILSERIKNSAIGKAKNCLKTIDIDPELVSGVNLSSIRAAHFSTADKRVKKQGEIFDDAREEIRLCNETLKGDSEKYTRLLEEKAKDLTSLTRELVDHRLSGYYFLDSLDTSGEENDGYVVLLRQVNTLPFWLAEKISRGLQTTRIAEMNNGGYNYLSHSDYGAAMPIGCLKSPDVEHLMQSFSALFSRIGIEDYPNETADQLIKRHVPGESK